MSEDYLRKLYSIQNPFDRRIYFCAVLAKELESEEVKPVVVGGTAVSFYTAGGYVTGDVDLVYPRRDLAIRFWRATGSRSSADTTTMKASTSSSRYLTGETSATKRR